MRVGNPDTKYSNKENGKIQLSRMRLKAGSSLTGIIPKIAKAWYLFRQTQLLEFRE
jgi:hypothetical protein